MLGADGEAPDFVLPALSGLKVSLSEVTGLGPVLLAFFKVSCPTCQYTLPFLERLTDARELKTIGISQDEEAATAEFRRAYGLSFPMALDDARKGYQVSNAYKITHVPSVFLVEGRSITEAFNGFSKRELERIGRRFEVRVFRPGEKVPDFRPG
jgi:peroxiredoxin